MSGERRIEVRGDTVVRPAAPWTATIHSLLSHLVAQGLPVPEPLELTADFEVVRLVPGDNLEDDRSPDVPLDGVRSAGRLLRAIHDGTRTWRPPMDAVWAVPVEGGPVICHGDPKPGNMTWRAGHAVGLFDWDDARPAEPVSDLAYAAFWLAPSDRDDSGARIHALLEGYRWDGPFDPIGDIKARRHRAIDEVEHLGRAGHEPAKTWLDQGWPEVWRRAMRPEDEKL